MAIVSPKFSFIRFEPLDDLYCNQEVKYKLPACGKHEAKFQFLVTDDLNESIEISLGVNGVKFAPDILAQRIDYRYKLNIDFTPVGSLFVGSFAIGTEYKEYFQNFTLQEFLDQLLNDFGIDGVFDQDTIRFNWPCKLPVELTASENEEEQVRLNSSVAYYWGRGYMQAPDTSIGLPLGTCFNYSLHNNSTSDVIATTNYFEVVTNCCYTSLITYSCEENAYDFHYADGQVNQVRLPFYLSRPLFPQKREVYINSKGKHKLLAAMTEKDYLLRTEWMIGLFHQCMSIALVHDSVVIGNENIEEKQVEVVSSENYQPEWVDDYEIVTAPAKCRVKVATFGYQNSNCGTSDAECTTLSCYWGLSALTVEYDAINEAFVFEWANIHAGVTALYKCEYSTNGGTSWTEVAFDNFDFTGGFFYINVPGLSGDNPYLFRITPMCGAGNPGIPKTVNYIP